VNTQTISTESIAINFNLDYQYDLLNLLTHWQLIYAQAAPQIPMLGDVSSVLSQHCDSAKAFLSTISRDKCHIIVSNQVESSMMIDEPRDGTHFAIILAWIQHIQLSQWHDAQHYHQYDFVIISSYDHLDWIKNCFLAGRVWGNNQLNDPLLTEFINMPWSDVGDDDYNTDMRERLLRLNRVWSRMVENRGCV
jgi:hypothetical protein